MLCRVVYQAGVGQNDGYGIMKRKSALISAMQKNTICCCSIFVWVSSVVELESSTSGTSVSKKKNASV